MLKSLLKDSVVYGVANAIQKLVPFFIMPVVIQQLGQAALKNYDIAFVYAYLFSWLIILGQDAAASILYFDKTKTSFPKAQILKYGLAVQLLVLLPAVALLILFGNNIAAAFFADDTAITPYWLLALLVIPGHLLLNYSLNILLWQKRKKEYIALCVCQTVFSLASAYLALSFFNGTLAHLFYGIVASNTFCGLIAFLLVRKTMQSGRLPVNGPLLKKLLWLGIPFALTSFFHQALPSFDRLFLLHYGYQQQLPQYILAVKLGGLVTMGLSAFVLAFTPYSMAKLNEAGAEKELSSLFRIVAVAGFSLVPVLLLFKDWLVQIFADNSFTQSATLLPFFFFGWIFDLFSYFSMLGIYKAQNSILVLAFFAGGLLLLCGLNVWLIPEYGLYGAAIAFCLSKAVLFFVPTYYLRPHFKLTIHAPSFITAGLVAALCSYLLYKVEWYNYLFILVFVLCGAAYYLYKQNFQQLLIYKKQLPL